MTNLPLVNGTSTVMPSRLGSNGPTYAIRSPELPKGRPRTATDEREPVDFGRRPLTAPGNKADPIPSNSHDDSDHNQSRLTVSKPPLLRSKSEHIVRREDADQADEEIYEWGARHGFEDHYQSEDIISQLANVSQALLHILLAMSPCRLVA